MRKRCTICKRVRLLKFFNKRARSKDGLQTHCTDCNKEKSKAYYGRNKETHKARTAESKAKSIKRNQWHVLIHLSENPCARCGEDDPVVLEFDHCRGDKEKNIADAVKNGWSLERLQAEMDKCQILCSNCHKKKTSKKGCFYKERMTAVKPGCYDDGRTFRVLVERKAKG